MEPTFSPPRPLRDYLNELENWEDGGFLWVKTDPSGIGLDTPCYLPAWDEGALSEAEVDEIEEGAEEEGYGDFMDSGMLSDIAANLKNQWPNHTEADLVKAIRYHWDFDAFIDLDTEDPKREKR